MIDYLDGQSPASDRYADDSMANDDFHHEHDQETLVARNARVRAIRDDEQATAGYVSLSNDATSTATIVAFGSELFERIEMHEPASPGGGSMMMRQISSLDI